MQISPKSDETILILQFLYTFYDQSPNSTFFPNQNRILPPSLKLPASDQRFRVVGSVLMDEVMTVGDAASKTSSSPLAPTPFLVSNLPLLSAFLAGAIAQFLKLFTTWYKERKWESKRMLDSGGMPSSHSATVTALAVAIALQEGSGGPAFAVAVVFACVVMYDASGVRLHAGRQAELLNQIVCEFPPEHPLSSIRPLRDSLGHTPLQVVAGAVLGCLVAYLTRNQN